MTPTIRFATADDAPLIHRFIVDLATYERERDAVQVTVDTLRTQLASDKPPFEYLIAHAGDEPVGFALFFTSYSTWRGRPGLYLEDLFVPESRRGRGFGLALLRRLAAIAVDRGYARMEWAVLDWNKPSIDFYDALDAQPLNAWIVYRPTHEPLERVAAADEAA